MAKYELKTKVNDASVKAFIASVDDVDKRAFCHAIIDMMAKATGEQPKMWGKAIVGFGTYTYTYASGQSGDWMRIGFSPRKANTSLYLMAGFESAQAKLKRLGKHKTGKSCLYVTKQADIDMAVLRELIDDTVAVMAERYRPQQKARASGKKASSKKASRSSQQRVSKKKAAKRAASKKKVSKKQASKKQASKKKTARPKAKKKVKTRKKRAAKK